MVGRTKGRKRVSADTKHKKSRQLRRQKQFALKKELRLFPTMNRLLLPRPACDSPPKQESVTSSPAETAEGGTSSKTPKIMATKKVFLLGQNGVLYPAVVTALPNKTVKSTSPILRGSILQQLLSKGSTVTSNPVVESGQETSVEKIQVKVELPEFPCVEEIPSADNDQETMTKERSPVYNMYEPLSDDTESSAARVSEEYDSSLIVKEEENDSSFIVKEEENVSSFVIKEEVNPIEPPNSSNFSPGRTVDDLENVEGPAEGVDQDTFSSYLFVEANTIKNDIGDPCWETEVAESSHDSRDQAANVDPLKANADYTEENLLWCSICRAHFCNEEALDNHLKSHAAEDLVCTICSERFFDETTLRDHSNIHKKEKTRIFLLGSDYGVYPCAACDERFAVVKDLLEHRKSHKVQQSCHLKCTKCDATFTRNQNLAKHMATHAPKQFQCFVCPERFPSKAYLNSHLRKHSPNGGLNTWKSWEAWKSVGNVVYKCLDKNAAKRAPRQFQCYVCTDSFMSKALLNTHLRARH